MKGRSATCLRPSEHNHYFYDPYILLTNAQNKIGENKNKTKASCRPIKRVQPYPAIYSLRLHVSENVFIPLISVISYLCKPQSLSGSFLGGVRLAEASLSLQPSSAFPKK